MNTPTKSDGGPAFPHLGLYPGTDGNLHPIATQEFGLSIRDWFAGMALNGMYSNQSLIDTFSHHTTMTSEAYHAADAMLAEREKL